MNDAQRRELTEIRAEQQRLRAILARLENRLTALETADEAAAVTPPVPTPVPVVTPPPAPMPEPVPITLPAPVPVIAPVSVPPSTPALSRPAPTPAPEAPPPLPAWLASPAKTEGVPVPQPPRPEPVPARESLEMRIGTTWFVRVGIVLLVTSLAFLGNYLYHHIVPHLGPAAKVSALYLAAGAVAGIGAWLERSRQGRESVRVRQYARIVLAGGLAAVYYVTYAAHYYERLRVIPNPLLAGVLLLGWASFMVWLAERRASETLATVAILLGFYTSAINEGVAGFTLVSNGFLAAGAVVLLRRHLWRVFPFASLLATYGSYAFWYYFQAYLSWRGLDVPPVHGGTRFWTECAFLLLYWLLFTWAALTARDESLPPVRRAAFAGLNNGAFFLLTTWLVLGEREHDFWKWSLGFGVVLVALAEVARRLPRRPGAQTESTFLTQGLLLVTLGFVTYFSGWQLSLVLVVQSVALLAAAGQRRSGLLLVLAWVTAFVTLSWVLDQILSNVPWKWWAADLGVGGFFLLAAWWSERLQERSRKTDGSFYDAFIAQTPWYFSGLALAVWWFLLGKGDIVDDWYAPVFAVAAVALSVAGHLLRIRPLPALALVYLFTAFFLWLAHFSGLLGSLLHLPWWNPLLVAGPALALGHWWRHRARADTSTVARIAGDAQIIAAILIAWLALTHWMAPWRGGAFTLAAAWSGFAVVVFAVGLLLRERLYRWLGLAVLAVTLLRVVLVDIWQLGSLERAVSAFVLSITLLGLGYLYNRYHDRWQNLL